MGVFTALVISNFILTAVLAFFYKVSSEVVKIPESVQVTFGIWVLLTIFSGAAWLISIVWWLIAGGSDG
jgi:hypothetical protein